MCYYIFSTLYSKNGDNMKVIKIILKVIMLILTAIWGMGCGILFPAFILASGEEIVAADIANSPVIIIWLITSIVGFILPAALVMCRRYIVASVMSIIGFIGILVVYSGFSDLYQYTKESTGPTELYMPCIFITIIIVLITILEKSKMIRESIENHNQKKNAVAPSIFGDTKNK